MYLYLSILLGYRANYKEQAQIADHWKTDAYQKESILQQNKDALAQIKQELRGWKNAHNILQEQYQTAINNCSETQNQLSEIEAQKKETRQNVEISLEKARNLEAAVNDLRDKNNCFKQKIKTLQNELRCARNENEELGEVSQRYREMLKHSRWKGAQDKILEHRKAKELERLLKQNESLIKNDEITSNKLKLELKTGADEKLQLENEILDLRKTLERIKDKEKEDGRRNQQEDTKTQLQMFLKDQLIKKKQSKIEELEAKLTAQDKKFEKQLDEVKYQIDRIKIDMEKINSNRRVEFLIRALDHIYTRILAR